MRRVAIAGVLAMRPSVLILDEPTAGLDPRGRDRILTMLEELHSRENVTIIMVSHSMDDMARLATRLVVFSEGKILATGTPREIFAREEMMISAGLDVPQAARLCRRLREKGFDLPADLYRPEELKNHILRLWKSAHSGKEETYAE
jgi:energy-coupling factor transport system ATP-binding protein